MSDDACTVALKNGLDEIRNVCPDISNIMVVRENGEVLCGDETVSSLAPASAKDVFLSVSDKAQVLGGLEFISVEGSQQKVAVARFNGFYVANRYSNKADERTVTNLTRVMVPTLLKMVKQVAAVQPTQVEQKVAPVERSFEDSRETFAEPQNFLPTPETLEFTVENLNVFNGLQSDSGTVYIDSGLDAKWKETFGEGKIATIKLESTTTHKQAVCKFAPFHNSKNDKKGIIMLPKKIQDSLQIHKGANILITPVIEEPKEEPEAEEIANSERKKPHGKENAKEAAKPEVQGAFLSSSAQNSQFIVENFGGISLVRNPDFVRVEPAVIALWKEQFGDKEITQVIIEETISGKRISCKCQSIKNSDLEGKGVVQMPDKMQQALKVKKGSLVLVKPVVE